LSKAPGQNWRRGKRRNRRNNEKADQSSNDASNFQTNDRASGQANGQASGDASSVSRADGSAHETRGHAPRKRSHGRVQGQEKGRRQSGGGNRDGSADALNGAPHNSGNRSDAGSSDNGLAASSNGVTNNGVANSSNKANGNRTQRNKARGRYAENGSALRNVRAPIKPAPLAVYSPKPQPEIIAKVEVGNAERGRPKRPHRHGHRNQEPYAALDLGTNNCRLLVALPQEKGRFRVIDGFSRIVRLGEGLAHSGRLSDAAMDRSIEALKICSEKLMSHGIKRHRLIATEACRQAENGQLFLDRVRSETGMTLEIIDRETEAHLAAEGCGALMDKKADAAVLFDIGGGSSELILVNKRIKKKRLADQIVSWTSLPIGVVTLAERHGGQVVNKEIFRNMINEVKGYLAKFEGRDELARLWKNGRVHLLGTSGTVTTLAGIHLKLPRYERRLVDGLWLNAKQIDVVVEDLLAMDYKQRANSPCIGSERADLVMAGCAILEAIRQTWPSDRLRVADRGLREGILTQMMDRDSAWLAPKEGRKRRNWPPQSRNRNASNAQRKRGNDGNRHE